MAKIDATADVISRIKMSAVRDVADLNAHITAHGIDHTISCQLIDRIPHVFIDDWDLYRDWKRTFGHLVGVDPSNICLIGSASIGFSLNPSKSFRPFSDRSDIDVAIISEYHFSVGWRALRNTRIADTQDARERQAIKDHSGQYIYWGCIAVDRVIRFMPFVREWTTALSTMSAKKPTEDRDIKCRIYKDYESLRQYHRLNIKNTQSKLLDQ